MSAQSLAQRTDATIARHTGQPTVTGFTFAATCPECGGPLTDDAYVSQSRRMQTRDTSCPACGRGWVVEVMISRTEARARRVAA